jgi:hypothetical protein
MNRRFLLFEKHFDLILLSVLIVEQHVTAVVAYNSDSDSDSDSDFVVQVFDYVKY